MEQTTMTIHLYARKDNGLSTICKKQHRTFSYMHETSMHLENPFLVLGA